MQLEDRPQRVAGHEQELAGGEQQPRLGALGAVDDDAGHDRGDRRHADRVVHEVLRQGPGGQQPVDEHGKTGEQRKGGRRARVGAPQRLADLRKVGHVHPWLPRVGVPTGSVASGRASMGLRSPPRTRRYGAPGRPPTADSGPDPGVYRGGMADNALDRAGEARLYAALRRFWHPVLWADELGDRPVAARAPRRAAGASSASTGEVRAFQDLCVHRGTALSLGWVEDGCLVCPYHGWTYDPDGVCTRIPSSHGTNIPRKARIQRFAAAEHAGLIWVCLGGEAGDEPPAMPLPAFPEWGDDAYRTIKIPQYDWHCSAARRVENFVDFSHFAWVHEGILGDRSKPGDPGPRRRTGRDHTLSFRLGIEEPANRPQGRRRRAGRIQRDAEPLHDLDAVLGPPRPAARGRPPLRAVRRVLPAVGQGDPQLHLERAQLRPRPGRATRASSTSSR